MSNLLKVKSLSSRVQQVYGAATRNADALAKDMGATCSKGCAACCYQLVGITFAEAIHIGASVLESRNSVEVSALLERLDEKAAYLIEFSRLTLEEVFLRRRPCAFLVPDAADSMAGICSIYKDRPLACRLHYVVSPPALCSPLEPYECSIIDTNDAMLEAQRQINGGRSLLAAYGPLAPFVAHAIRCLRDGVQPSLLEIVDWERRMAAFLNRDKAMMARTGKIDKYVAK